MSYLYIILLWDTKACPLFGSRFLLFTLTHIHTHGLLLPLPLCVCVYVCSPLSLLPRCYHGLASSLQNFLQWLICDELVSIGRSLSLIDSSLLQGVATHVQTTPSTIPTAYAKHVPLKFVMGEINSMTYFALQLEALDIPGYTLVKVEEYYYLTPKPHTPYQEVDTPDLLGSHSDIQLLHQYSQSSEPLGRSRTPPPAPPILPRGHRRAQSSGGVAIPRSPGGVTTSRLSGGVSASRLKVLSLPSSKDGSDRDIHYEDIADVSSGYEAGCSADSLLFDVKDGAGHVLPEGLETPVWMVLRVMSHQVDVYFQIRSSKCVDERILSELEGRCDQLKMAVEQTCYHTNQWYLLKDMFETHMCSPYLLSESASEAWVEKVVEHQGTSEPFRAQEFMCDLVHSFHITPHWRIKDMKGWCGL